MKVTQRGVQRIASQREKEKERGWQRVDDCECLIGRVTFVSGERRRISNKARELCRGKKKFEFAQTPINREQSSSNHEKEKGRKQE